MRCQLWHGTYPNNLRTALLDLCTASPQKWLGQLAGSPLAEICPSHLFAQTVNTFIITARECERALAEFRLKTRPGLVSHLALLVEWARIELKLSALVFMTWLSSLGLC